MSRPDGPVADLEEATDQLVDEISQRLAALYALIDTSLAEAGPPAGHIRRHAASVVYRLANPHPRPTAVSVARALWLADTGSDVPTWWWATPLGVLIARGMDRSEPPSGSDPQPRQTP